jgi:DNA-binding response OmpR family regulator
VKLYNQELIQKIFRKLNEEIKNSKHLISKLITDYATELIMKECNNSINYKSIKLLSNPTAQEINILNSMLQNNNPVSRDEIAQILWGKSWNMKYSDWAIDKSISRLRKKISGNEIRILTIKNFGYQLFK